jgi:hypothetical protein|tara:strand:- start:644 stop:958 length:315 start_codon:yes stop_codon:yes gene_type:complete
MKREVEVLKENIKKNYAAWMSSDEMIERFNTGVKTTEGKKWIKVIQGSSVWGFIAKENGTHKGIPHKKGDTFKAAGWAAPAKWARGNIFDTNTNWFSWTGPNYL